MTACVEKKHECMKMCFSSLIEKYYECIKMRFSSAVDKNHEYIVCVSLPDVHILHYL
jgi:hypothetical protein